MVTVSAQDLSSQASLSEPQVGSSSNLVAGSTARLTMQRSSYTKEKCVFRFVNYVDITLSPDQSCPFFVATTAGRSVDRTVTCKLSSYAQCAVDTTTKQVLPVQTALPCLVLIYSKIEGLYTNLMLCKACQP